MSYLQFDKEDIMRFAELGVMALLGLIVLFTAVRPLVRRIIAPDGAAGTAIAAAGGGVGAIAAPTLAPMTVEGGPGEASRPNVSIVGSDEQVAISNRTSAMIDVAKVQGQVHAQSVQKVGELAEKNPHEAVSIIRSWLHEDAA
jgi:flagellar M-ring protein FliF